MPKHSDEHEFERIEYQGGTGSGKQVVKGLLIGSLVGAAAMLLFAPRSGQETRAEIRDKAAQLRDRTTETVKDTVSQMKSRAFELKESALDDAAELKQRGKLTAHQQLERASQAVDTGKQRIEEF